MPAAFRLEGSSMLPVFKPGGLVLTEAAAPGELSPGDCAVYVYEGRTLLHRVLRTGQNGVLLGDDAGRLEPHLVPWGGIKGRVLGRNPLGGGLCGLLYSRLRRALSRLYL